MADVQSLLVANEKLSQEVLRPGADQIDQSRSFPRENIAALGKAGVLACLFLSIWRCRREPEIWRVLNTQPRPAPLPRWSRSLLRHSRDSRER
jgi:hypothetical protein